MEEKKHHTNWEREWLEGNISSDEASKYAPDNTPFDAFAQFIEGASQLDVPRDTSTEQAWGKLQSKIGADSSPKVISLTRRNWLIGIAASFILALGAFFLLPTATDQTIINTGLAEYNSVQLPDGSTVHLNAVSNVSFSKKAWKESRELNLNGEAFFEVKRGSNFTVNTELGTVQVLGTSFNVRERNGQLIVACKTGKVRVTDAASGKFVDITPGKFVVAENGDLSEVEEINTNRVASWMKNEFDFESLAIQEVFSELERQYDITITSDYSENELKETFTATLPTDDLKSAVETIEAIKRVKAEYSEDGQSIKFFRE